MSLSVLDLYILSMLDRGCETPYSLQRTAGISLGGSLPSLRELSKAKLVSRAINKESGKRARHEYSLTTQGRAALRTGWKAYLDADVEKLDLDSVLRIAEMALHYGDEKSSVADLLKRAAEHRQYLGQRAEVNCAHIPASTKGLPTYTKMRAACDAKRFYGEAAALIALAAKLSPKNKRGKKASNGVVYVQGSLLTPTRK